MPTPDVALVGTYPTAGERHGGASGVASYTANLAHALAGAGASVTVTAAREPGEAPTSHDGGVRVERHFDRGRRALPNAVAAAAATGAPVVHVQHELFLYGGPAAIPGLLPALGRRTCPTVVTLHQVVDPSTVDGSFTALHRVRAPAPLARWGVAGVQDAVGRLSDAVIVHEPAFARHVNGACVVPHGVETPPLPDRDAARLSLGLDDRLTVLCFGFVAPYKGLETALEAAALAGPAVQLVIAGGEHPRLAGRDPYASDLRAAGKVSPGSPAGFPTPTCRPGSPPPTSHCSCTRGRSPVAGRSRWRSRTGRRSSCRPSSDVAPARRMRCWSNGIRTGWPNGCELWRSHPPSSARCATRPRSCARSGRGLGSPAAISTCTRR